MQKPRRSPVRQISDEEEVRIQAGIVADKSNPEFTAEEFARAMPLSAVLPEIAARLSAEKTSVTLKLDRDLVEHFKAGGRDWQERLNAALRSAVNAGA